MACRCLAADARPRGARRRSHRHCGRAVRCALSGGGGRLHVRAVPQSQRCGANHRPARPGMARRRRLAQTERSNCRQFTTWPASPRCGARTGSPSRDTLTRATRIGLPGRLHHVCRRPAVPARVPLPARADQQRQAARAQLRRPGQGQRHRAQLPAPQRRVRGPLGPRAALLGAATRCSSAIFPAEHGWPAVTPWLAQVPARPLPQLLGGRRLPRHPAAQRAVLQLLGPHLQAGPVPDAGSPGRRLLCGALPAAPGRPRCVSARDAMPWAVRSTRT